MASGDPNSEPSAPFSVMVVTSSGRSFEVAGLLPSDTTSSLFEKATDLTGIPRSFLKLALGDQLLPASSHASLSAAGLGVGSSVTAVRSADPLVFWRGYEIRQDFDWNWFEIESHERVLFDSDGSCFFAGLDRTQTEWSMDSNDVLQWDVLHGTYELQGDVALCQWERHLHRKFNQTSGSLNDSCWEEKDPRASLKWQQIRLPGNADDAKFRALIVDAAPENGPETNLANVDWFQQNASARCREWPAASFGDGLIETYTPYWHSIGMMSSESGDVSARALCKLITEEETIISQDGKLQEVQCEAMHRKDLLWKDLMKPMRLDAVSEDGFPAMDAVKAVGMWRELDKTSTLNVLQNGLESYRGVDVENCCLLGIPLLCTGGVVPKEGEEPRDARKAGGAWIETKGTVTSDGILSELLAALRSDRGAICGQLSVDKLRERGLGRYHFCKDSKGKGSGKGRVLIRVDNKVDTEWRQEGDVIVVTAPFTTASSKNNVEVQEGDEGTILAIEDNRIKVEFLEYNASPDQAYWIDEIGMKSVQKKLTPEERLALAWIEEESRGEGS